MADNEKPVTNTISDRSGSDVKDGTKRRVRWAAIIIPSLIGVLFTIGMGYYAISRSEEEKALAQKEKIRSVKQNLVNIIEEHVINQSPFDLQVLSRMIDIRTREEGITSAIVPRDLIERAEYNIINSRYLDFKQKDEYKAVFAELYKKMSERTFTRFTDTIANASLANELANYIQEGKSDSALSTLGLLVERYTADIAAQTVRKESLSWSDAFRQLAEKPWIWVVMVLYVFTFSVYYILRVRLRTLRLDYLMRHESKNQERQHR